MSHPLLDGITWFRGSSVRIRHGDVEVHVDPYGGDDATAHDRPADFILLTHPHYDNFSEADIARLRSSDTVVIAPASMKKQLSFFPTPAVYCCRATCCRDRAPRRR